MYKIKYYSRSSPISWILFGFEDAHLHMEQGDSSPLTSKNMLLAWLHCFWLSSIYNLKTSLIRNFYLACYFWIFVSINQILSIVGKFANKPELSHSTCSVAGLKYYLLINVFSYLKWEWKFSKTMYGIYVKISLSRY